MKKPCNECPFRKDSLRGWLADYTPEGLHNLVVSEISFPCHMASQSDSNIELESADLYPPCMGAISYAKKAGKLPRRQDLMERMKLVNPSDMENILSPQEFIKHHSVGRKKQK